MGIRNCATAALGQRVEIAKLCREVATRECEHTIPDGAKFCPECGKANKPILVKRWLDGYKAGDDGAEWFGDLALVRHADSNWGVLCLSHVSTGDGTGKPKMAETVPGDAVIYNTKRELYAALNKHGLYDESLFGLWVILETSP